MARQTRAFPLARVLFALAVALIVAGAGAIVFSQPPEARVSGVCRDSVTHQPIANVDITLDRNDTSDTASDGDTGDDSNPDSTNPSPSSWAQGSDDDSTVDLAGADNSPRGEWHMVTDDQGRFAFPHVPVGEYTLNAVSNGHTLPEQHVVVLEGQERRLDFAMDRIGPHLSFETSNFNWLPTENPTVALEGQLDNRSVEMVLSRIDLDKTPAPIVSDLASGDTSLDTGDSSAHISSIPVRRWTHAVANADKEGSFYDRIGLANDDLTAGAPATLPPGIYLVTAKTIDNGQYVEAHSWAIVTNLAVVSKSYDGQALVYVADLATGRPIPGVQVALYNQARGETRALLSSAASGADGTAKLTTTGAVEESSGLVYARLGSSVCSLAIDLNSPGSDEEDEDDTDTTASYSLGTASLRSFIYTERPVYRPGQTVFVKGILRLFDREKGFSVPAGKKVSLDIRDAQDTLISHQDVTTNDMGSFTARVALSPETLTGEYTIWAKLGDQAGSATFMVAAYHKPEYQAAVSFSKDRYVRGETIQATIAATYYYGAPVAGAKAFVDVERSDDSADDSSGQPMHVDSDKSDSGEPVLSKDLVLDSNGQVRIAIPTKDQPQTQWDTTYTVNVTIEEAGQDITAQGTATVAQGDFTLNVTPSSTIAHKGDTISAAVAATGDNAIPVPGRSITLTAEYQDWDWRTGRQETTRVSVAHGVTGPDGTAQFTATATRVGLLALIATAADTHGNKITDESDVWVPGAHEEIQARYSDLGLVLDRPKYQPGQTAHLLINTAHPGTTALVTIEGATLYRYLLVPLAGHSTAVDLPVEQAFAPSVTVSVCCVANKQFYQSTQDLVIDDPKLPLLISVQADKPTYHPDDPALITIRTTDKLGHPVPAEVSVGVVDSAIYAIQPEPDTTIGEAMEPDQGDSVQTADSCETVYYGDVDKGSTAIDIRHRFPDTALWKPDIMTGADGTARVSLALPDTLTTWRITCYGHTRDTLVGKGVGNMVVNKDLLVRLETPPFLTAGNQSTLVAVVNNNTTHAVTADVHLAVAGMAVVSGAADPTVTVAPKSPARLTWQVRADQPGQAQATVTAQAGALSDGIEEDFPVDPHGATTSVWHSGSLLHQVTDTVVMSPKALANSTVLRVRLSPSIASSILPALDYLSSYPYGCTDATVSALVPDAILARAGNVEGQNGGPAIVLSAAQEARLRDQTQRSLLRLYRMQRDDGGWGWFITDQSDLWMTADSVWGLELAKQAGFPVNQSILDAGVQETATLANTARSQKNYKDADYDSLALAALALAEAGDKPAALGNTRWLEKMWAAYPLTENNQDKAMVALAEWLVADKKANGLGQERAYGLMTDLWAVARVTGSECSWTASYHSGPQGVAEDLPDSDATAWCLFAAESITPADPRIEQAARWLVENRAGDHWDCPDTTSLAVLALSSHLRSTHEMQPDFESTLVVNGVRVNAVHFGPDSIDQPDRVIEIPGTALHPGVNSVELAKQGPGRLYYSLELRECIEQPAPARPPSLLQKLVGHLAGTYPPKLAPAPSGYWIRRAYLRLTSRRNFFWEDTVPAPDTSYRQREDILVRLIIDCTRPASRVVIEEPIPAGCRVLDANSDDMEDWENWWDYTDVRDDKVVFFVHDMTAGEHEIDYHLEAQTGGSYDIMPPQITSLVDPTLQALGPASHIDIEEAGS